LLGWFIYKILCSFLYLFKTLVDFHSFFTAVNKNVPTLDREKPTLFLREGNLSINADLKPTSSFMVSPEDVSEILDSEFLVHALFRLDPELAVASSPTVLDEHLTGTHPKYLVIAVHFY
jgi:hypothetical protein